MPKLTLTQNPTFPAKAPIPVPGEAKPVMVEFTFKNRTREAYAKWLKEMDGKDKDAVLMEMASGWELEDAFTPENVALFLSNYLAAFDAILETYLRELTQAKEKN